MQDGLRIKVDALNSSRPVFWLFCLFLVLPIWLVDYPPMVDLPGHASQIQLMHNLRNGDFLYSDLFRRYYLTPYWGGYVPVYLLSFIFGVLASLKIIITFALVGIPYFTKKIINKFGGNPAWVWLCFPVAYSSPFYWGFLNYIITVSIGLGWVYFCIKISDRDVVGWRTQLTIALGIIVLFFGHLIACGMLGLIVAIYYCFLKKTVKQRVSLLAPLLIFVPLAGVFFWLQSSNNTGLPSQFDFGYNLERYRNSLSILVGRPTWWSGLAGPMMLITPFWTGGILTRRLSRLLPFVIILLFVLLLPLNMMGTTLIYQRFFIFVVPLLLLALEYRPETATSLRNLLPVVIALIVMSINTSDILEFAVEHKDYKKVIEQAEPDSRISKIMANKWSKAGNFMHPVYNHFPSWHHLRGKGLVDYNFASYGQMPVSYKDVALTKIPRSGFAWSQNHGECYNYFISRADFDLFFSPVSTLAIYGNKVDLVAHSGKWYLHKNKNPKVCN
ncbi:hypothetical protein ACFLZU_04705 [Thermodesulfobacteriota bacterium]